jgi:uncharacterized Ntn-hydrolase superfamily protein
MTYSIVARDSATRELGVAVQSRYFAVGSVVPWAEPGVGAVATQSFAEVRYGPLGLALMRGSHSASDALRALLAGDGEESLRQVAMVDAAGMVAAHTGSRCVEAAGHVPGDGVSAQGNMMERDTVWPAMLAAFGASGGPLANRLLAALEAAEGEGGDIRGRQSAALIVVSGSRQDLPWMRKVDVRVDDHPDPVTEMGRLIRLNTAFRLMEQAADAATTGDFLAAAAAMDQASPLAPDDDQVAFRHGGALMAVGRIDEGRAELERALLANPRWAVFLRRFAAKGFLPDDPAFLDAVLPLEPS